jgi:orotate phosphoribosyltransferase
MTVMTPSFADTTLPAQLRQQLKEAIQTHAIKHGDFVLASGKRSSYYIDCRRVTLNGFASQIIGESLVHLLKPHHLDAVGGVLMGAAPLVTATTVAAASQGIRLDGFLIRKAIKKHGMQRLVEGHCQPWMRVALLEDVVTTGGSVIEGIAQLRDQYPNLQIEGVVSLVDREAGGREAFGAEGIPYQPIFNVSELL